MAPSIWILITHSSTTSLTILIRCCILLAAVNASAGAAGQLAESIDSRLLTTGGGQVLVASSGSSVKLHCPATDNVNSTLLWLLEDRLLSSDYSHGANSVLSLENVQLADAGFYRCLTFEPGDGLLSSLTSCATLIIAEKPTFTALPYDSVVSAGQSVRLECQASGSPAPNISWYHNDTVITSSEDGDRVLVLPSGVLQIRNFMPFIDSGVYSCRAVNSLGNIIAQALLSTSIDNQISNNHAQGAFLAKPKNLLVKLGDDALFECFPQNGSGMKFRWERVDGLPFPSQDRIRLLGSNLLLKRVERFDKGYFACIVQYNDTAEVYKASAELIVHYEPEILVRSNELVKPRGSSARLSCFMDSFPPPSVVWFKEGRRIDPFGRTKLVEPEAVETPSGSVTNLFKSDLLISSLRAEDAGLYQCLAINRFGQSIGYVKLAVTHTDAYQEETPRDLRAIVSQSDKVVRLHWHSASPKGRIVAYMIHYHTDAGEQDDPENTQSLSPDESCDQNGSCYAECCTYSSLLPATRYVFWVSGVVANGLHSAPSNEILVYTWDETSPSSVLPLTAQSCSKEQISKSSIAKTCAKLSWERPSKLAVRGTVTEYRIEYAEALHQATVSQIFVPPTTWQHVFTDLSPNAWYVFRVIPSTKAGYPSEETSMNWIDFPWLRFKTAANDDLGLDLEHVWNNQSSLLTFLHAKNAEKSIDCSVSLIDAVTHDLVSGQKVTLSKAAIGSKLPHVALSVSGRSKLYQISLACSATHSETNSSGSSSVCKLIRGYSTNGRSGAKIAKISNPNWPVPPVYDVECLVDPNSGKFGLRWKQPGGDLIVSYFIVRYDAENASKVLFTNSSRERIYFDDLVGNRSYAFSVQTVSRDNKRSKFSEDLICFVPADLTNYPFSPVSIKASAIDGKTAFVTWTDPGATFDSSIKHYVLFRVVDTVEWTEVLAEDRSNSLVLAELSPDLKYEIAVLAETPSGRRSAPSASITVSLSHAPFSMTSFTQPGEHIERVTVERVSYVEGMVIGFCIVFVTVLLCLFLLIRRTDDSGNRASDFSMCQRLARCLFGRRLSSSAAVRKATRASLLGDAAAVASPLAVAAASLVVDDRKSAGEFYWREMETLTTAAISDAVPVHKAKENEWRSVPFVESIDQGLCPRVKESLDVLAGSLGVRESSSSPALSSDSNYSSASRSRNSDSTASSCNNGEYCRIKPDILYSNTSKVTNGHVKRPLIGAATSDVAPTRDALL